ncbi:MULTISPECIES: DNZ54_00345 family protein [Citrobacter]|uniref:DNZ54_00345 family protein n=1 Tax=Citrobacter TaxID=544 RepID=UPI000E3BF2E6|nr:MULTISPECIES: DNZ54_00345 family protein [Citrobacter]MBD0830362.1 hypothetical protein [Citrobacter sp. C1]RFU89011.1 hypothetical protein DZA29_24020 [Citrobacter gillenii]
MKKCLKWIFDISLLVMILLGFMYPQSAATTVVAFWAWLGVGICALLICVGAVCQFLWLHSNKTGFAVLTRRAFGLDVRIRLSKQFRFVIMTALVAACLINSGMLTVTLCYLAAVLGFRFLRSVLLMVSGEPLCHVSSV